MNRILVGAVIVAATLAAVTLPVVAKGRTVKLTIMGPGITATVDVTAPTALANVWGGEFLAGAAAEPNADLPRYVVSFHVALPQTNSAASSEVRVMYVVEFCRDPLTGVGYVYLPGQGDARYRLNARTILREGQDGTWQRAAPGWSEAVSQAIWPN
jgi:hypothetical protein